MMFNTGDLILDAVILSIVARTPEGTYGYKITQDVRSKMDVPESTFYPLLKQMQMDGYLEVYHKDLGGRSRRFYKITEAGKERLEFCQQNWANYLQSASSLLMGAPVQDTAQPEEVPVAQAEPVPAVQPQPEVVPVAQAEPVPAVQPQPEVVPVAQAEPVPVVQPQPEVVPVAQAEPVPSAEDTEIHITANNGAQNMADIEFSIGGEEPMAENDNLLSDEGDLFEFDINVPASAAISFDEAPAVEEPVVQTPVVEAPVMEQPVVQTPVAEAPVMEQPVVQTPVAEAPVMEQPVVQTPVAEVPVMEQPANSETVSDDEADFFAEMAMGDAEEELMEDTPITEETESSISNSASELESLLSQLRSFESKMTAHREFAENSSANAETNINITDLNAVAALLNAAPQVQTTEPVVEAAPEETVQAVQTVEPEVPVQPEASSTQETATVTASNSTDTKDSAVTTETKETPNEPERSIRYAEVRNPETDDSVNSLVDLLKDDQPVRKARFFKPRAAKEVPVEKVVTPVEPKVVAKPVQPEAKATPIQPVQNEHKIQLTEVRNPETDEAVNSLVDLLKDDGSSKKPKLFRGWGKSSSAPAELKHTPTPAAPKPSPAPVAEAKPIEPVAEKVVSQKVELKEIRNPETDDAVNSLVDLLKDDQPTRKARFFKPKAAKEVPVEKVVTPVSEKPVTPVQPQTKAEPVPTVTKKEPVPAVPKPVVAEAKPVQPATATRTVKQVSEDNSVDSLVELLRSDKQETKPVSIFGKSSAKTYTKANIPQPTVSAKTTPIQDTAIPKPVVSEPKAFEPKQTSVSSVTNKPTTAKTFEAKAASPNARPVETTATITKPLEAKAISTKPTVAKPTEAKSVETKAVVTPKAETAKPDTTPAASEKKAEEIPMDSFKYRLMQAHLLPEDK